MSTASKVKNITTGLKKLATTYPKDRKRLVQQLREGGALESIGEISEAEVANLAKKLDMLDFKHSKERLNKKRKIGAFLGASYFAPLGAILGVSSVPPLVGNGKKALVRALLGASIAAIPGAYLGDKGGKGVFNIEQNKLLSKLGAAAPIFLKEKQLLQKQDKIVKDSIDGNIKYISKYKNVENELDRLHTDNVLKFWDREKKKGRIAMPLYGALLGGEWGAAHGIWSNTEEFARGLAESLMNEPGAAGAYKNLIRKFIIPKAVIGAGIGALGVGYLSHLYKKNVFQAKQREIQKRLKEKNMSKQASGESRSLLEILKSLSIDIGELTGKAVIESGNAAKILGEMATKNPQYVLPTAVGTLLLNKVLTDKVKQRLRQDSILD